MTVESHVQSTLGNMIMQICQAHAEIDRLKEDNARLQTELEKAKQPEAPQTTE